MDDLIPTVIDCDCGLRYMRSGVRTLAPEIGHAKCACGAMLASWNGAYRLSFEPEEGEQPH